MKRHSQQNPPQELPPLPDEALAAFKHYPFERTSEHFNARLAASVLRHQRQNRLFSILSIEVAGLSISGILLAAALGVASSGVAMWSLHSPGGFRVKNASGSPKPLYPEVETPALRRWAYYSADLRGPESP